MHYITIEKMNTMSDRGHLNKNNKYSSMYNLPHCIKKKNTGYEGGFLLYFCLCDSVLVHIMYRDRSL